MMVNSRPVQATLRDHVSNKTQRQSNVLELVSLHRQRIRESEEGHVGQIPKRAHPSASLSSESATRTLPRYHCLAPLPSCPSLKKLREMNADS